MGIKRTVWEKEKSYLFCKSLIKLRKEIENMYERKEITKNKRGRMKNKLKELWHIYYNKRADIPESIKQGFNLLYT